jgi:hypothetical protein
MNKTHTLIKRKLENVVSRLRRGNLNSHETVQTYTQKEKLYT